MAGLINEFTAITHEFNRQAIDYAVCGGWAVTIHGLARATLDIDLLILTEDLDKAIAAAKNIGFHIEGLPLNFDGGKTQIRRISKIDTESKELITLDLIVVGETYKEAWKGRRKVSWNNGDYKVVSVKGLIQMKEIAGRPKDLIDLYFLRGLEDDED